MIPDPRPLITTSFTIDGVDLDPQECTREIGLEPTRAARRGERRRPESRINLVTSVWCIAIDKQPSLDTNEGLSQLLDVIWPRRVELRDYLKATKWNAGFTTSLTIHDERPLYLLSHDSLCRMSFFGLEYSMDIHDYSG